MSVTSKPELPPPPDAGAVEAPRSKETLIDAAEKWLVYRGVPHFLKRREDLEVRPATVGLSVILAASFGAVAADAEGLPASAQIAIGAGVVLAWLLVDVVRRRLRKESDRFRWPRPGHVNVSILVAIAATMVADAAYEWHEEHKVALLALAWASIVLVIAAATPLGALRIVVWAAGHPFREAAQNVKVLAGGLPLLLLTVGFLFLTSELWHVATYLSPPALAGAVGFFVVPGGFLLFVLARSHIAEAQRFADWNAVRACLGDRRPDPLAPLETLEAAVNECLDRAAKFNEWQDVRDWLDERKRRAAAENADRPNGATNGAALRLQRLRDESPWGELGNLAVPDLGWRERWNITIVLLFGQAVQVLAVTLVMAAFLLAFGRLTVREDTLEAWQVIPKEGTPQDGFLGWSGQHLKVTALLAAFAGLSFAVYAVLYKDQREIFFGELDRKATQRLAVRALYRRLLEIPR